MKISYAHFLQKLKTQAMSINDTSNWNEYSRLVLKELETLSSNILNLNKELQDLKKEIAVLHDRENRVDELKVWKAKIDEFASPAQIGELVTQVEELRQFKTKAITVFAIIQFLLLLISIFGNKLGL
jgi:hypothetical protein